MSDIPDQVTQYTDQSLTAIHHALRASRRRLVIGLVGYRAITNAQQDAGDGNIQKRKQSEVTVTVRQLAREVVSIEKEIPLDHATGDPYHNVYNSLIQTHLPELDDVGAVEYDSDRKKVTPGRNLVALAMVAAITSPIAQILFHNAVADFYSGGDPS